MTNVAVRDLGQSALSAFRADMPLGGRELTPADGDTLTVATLLRQASVAPKSAASRRMLREARRIAEQSLGKARLDEGGLADPVGPRLPLDVFRVLSERCSDYAQLHVADHILESLERLAVPDSLTAGRVAHRRSRVAWELGQYESAEARATTLLESKAARQYDELKLRAWSVLATAAFDHGNMPKARGIALGAIRESRGRYPRHELLAWEALGVIDALAKNFDSALQHFWKAYALGQTAGFPRRLILDNIAQLLLDTGHPGPARAAFARLLAGPSCGLSVYTVLGGYAAASAALADQTAVEWATREVLVLAKRPGNHPRKLAYALLECSEALAACGHDARAGTLRRRSLQLSERYGFHDLIFRAQPTTKRATPTKTQWTDAAEEIVAHVIELEPDSLPHELVYAD